MSPRPRCMVSLKHGERGWHTSSTASPQYQRSPMQTSSSVPPAVLRFSPNGAGPSSWPSSAAHFGRCSDG